MSTFRRLGWAVRSPWQNGLSSIITCSLVGVFAMVGGCVAPQSRIARADEAMIKAEAQAQREVAVQTIVERRARLQNLAFPIWKANADLCGEDTRVTSGATVETASQYAEGDLAATFRGHLKLGDRVSVTHVIPSSPAEGILKPGDVVLGIGGVQIGSGAVGLSDLRRAVDTMRPGLPATFRIERDGTLQDLSIVPVKVCSYAVHYQPGSEINAYADGSAVYVTAGMMRFVENDEELAVVLGHELAHNALGHIDAQQVNAGVGLIFDILAAGAGVNTQGAFTKAGRASYSQDFESEADYVGIYYLARAQTPISRAAMFWRRMAAENPGSIPGSYQATHPSTAQRFSQLEQAVQEIGAKYSTGAPLLPNNIKGDVALPAASESPDRPTPSGNLPDTEHQAHSILLR